MLLALSPCTSMPGLVHTKGCVAAGPICCACILRAICLLLTIWNRQHRLIPEARCCRGSYPLLLAVTMHDMPHLPIDCCCHVVMHDAQEPLPISELPCLCLVRLRENQIHAHTCCEHGCNTVASLLARNSGKGQMDRSAHAWYRKRHSNCTSLLAEYA